MMRIMNEILFLLLWQFQKVHKMTDTRKSEDAK